MAKVAVVYRSSFGNTKLVAEKIGNGLKKAGVEIYITDYKELDWQKITQAQAIIVGSPNHMGNAVKEIRNFIQQLGKEKVKAKVAVFDTYMAGDFEKAVRKMEGLLKEKAPTMEILMPGLSIKVTGMKGPVPADELDKAEEFGAMNAKKLKGI